MRRSPWARDLLRELAAPTSAQIYGVQPVDPLNELRQLLQHGSQFVEPRMNGGGRLEFHFC